MPGQCSECSAEFTDDASACSACGAPLSTAKTLPQESTERRLLSIVFADLVGSTRLSQTLELEDYNDLLRAYEKACAAVVERWGSEIVQQYGDGILFYLGYPVSHEDDARRAVGAAFEIAQVAPQIRIPASARSLEVRVGVHTGMTVIEAVGSAERRVHLARGAVPNLASRIQALAAPNTVVISESTRALIQGYWECEPLNQHFDGLQLYRVVAATGAARSIDAAAAVGLTQFVGRADEVAALQKSWSRSIEGATDAVLVMGEAGIGKSRLVQVLKAHVARGPARVVEWSCSRDAQATALRPVAEAVARQVGITDGSASEERLTKLQHGMAALGSFKQDAVWLMASLLSIPVGDLRGPPDTTPQGIRKRTLETLLEILKAFCSREALLLVIEDVHWADPSTLELVGLDLPETTFETEAVWYVPEAEQLDGLTDMPTLLGTLHAAEHAMIAILPLWAMCDRWDIGGLSTNIHYQTGSPTVFVYDGHSGGVGITERGFETFEGWVDDTATMLDGCPCESGCPSCVQSPKCGNLNEPLDKAGALELLGRMLNA